MRATQLKFITQLLLALGVCATAMGEDTEGTHMQTYEEFLRTCAAPKDVIDVFLDPSQPTWAQFDPVCGYRLGTSMPKDGLDGSRTISTAGPNGARTARMYTERPCRINTYGNSFTQCHQVSDGETWQEYLAAHFGEPIRNYGMGGYGTYQAYRRMLLVEQSPEAAKSVILYLWGDDHLRNVMRCRYALIQPFWDSKGGRAFHNNFWANIEMDLDKGEFVERENLLPTPESLYKMTDPEFMAEALKDDLMLQLCVAGKIDPKSLDLDSLDKLAACLGTKGIDRTSGGSIVKSCERLKHEYGFAATEYILDKAAEFCRDHDKNLLILMLDPRVTTQMLHGQLRYDAPLLEFIQARGFRYFDMNQAHLDDFASFKISPEQYMRRYFIGHYNPAGNHFFAFEIKDAVLDMLDPRPVTYLEEGTPVDFSEYLPDNN